MSCDICTESFNKSSRRPIQCFRCHDLSGTPHMCATCVQTYLINTTQAAHCMHCRVAWDRPFLANTMTKEFMKTTFKTHREQLLETEQRSLLPSMMPILAQEQRYQRVLEESKEIEKKISFWVERRQQNERQQTRVFGLLRRMKDRSSRGLPLEDVPPIEQAQAPETSTSTPLLVRDPGFSRPCAFPECRGFLEPRTGLCLVCQHTTCLKCNNILSSEEQTENHHHQCKQEDLLQWETIQKTTKPCPGCQTRIFKISGCHQMWCPICHTAFHWQTGQIERGSIHNPHYYEWMFSDRNDVPRRPHYGCGHPNDPNMDNDLMDVRDFRHTLSTRLTQLQRETKQLKFQGKMMYYLSKEESAEQCLKSIHRFVSHTRHDTIRNYRFRIEGTGQLAYRNMETRLLFLKKKITEEEFRRQLQRDEKLVSKLREYIQFLDTYVVMISDLFRRFCNSSTFTFEQWTREYQEMTNITNHAIDELNKCYQSRLSKMPLLQTLSISTS